MLELNLRNAGSNRSKKADVYTGCALAQFRKVGEANPVIPTRKIKYTPTAYFLFFQWV